MDGKIWYLKRCELFENLTALQADRLERRAKLRQFRRLGGTTNSRVARPKHGREGRGEYRATCPYCRGRLLWHSCASSIPAREEGPMQRADPPNYTYVHYSAGMLVARSAGRIFSELCLVANG